MLKQLQTWLRIRKQQQTRRPRFRTIPTLELLEERWCPAGDTYTWNPGNVNLLASNPANWLKNGVQQGAGGTLPGNNVNDTAVLDTNTAVKNIEWDQNFKFSTLNIKNNFNADNIIDSGVTLDLTGANGTSSLNATGAGSFFVCAGGTSTLQIDNNLP